MARVRNLEVRFGPAYADWTLISGPLAPAVPAPPSDSASNTPVVHPDGEPWPSPTNNKYLAIECGDDGGSGGQGGQGVEGSGSERGGLGSEGVEHNQSWVQREGLLIGSEVAQGSATDEDRLSLRAAIVKYCISAEREEALGALAPGDGGTTAYLDQIVMLAIMLNTICMALEHFEGYAVHVEVAHQPSDHCFVLPRRHAGIGGP